MTTTGYVLRLVIDRLEAGASMPRSLPAMPRVIYCRSGGCRIEGGPALGEDEAHFSTAPTSVTAGKSGAVIWRWELDREGASPVLAGTSTVAVEERLDGPDPAQPWILRCDSVKFPMGGQAFLHVHQGPGIRCLRDGEIRIDTGGASHQYRPGDAWFEPGPVPVFAQSSEFECTRFVRVMVLPAELKGKSSIVYVNEEDRDKPKSQRYQGYVDEPIEH